MTCYNVICHNCGKKVLRKGEVTGVIIREGKAFERIAHEINKCPCGEWSNQAERYIALVIADPVREVVHPASVEPNYWRVNEATSNAIEWLDETEPMQGLPADESWRGLFEKVKK